MIRKISVVCFSMMAFLAAHAEKITLTETLINAYNTSPDLAAKEQGVKASQENVSARKRQGWLPAIALKGVGKTGTNHSTSKYKNIGPQSTQSKTNSAQGSLTAQQNIFKGGQTVAGIRAAEQGVLADGAIRMREENRVLFEAVLAHIEILKREALVNASQKNVDVLTEQLRNVQARHELGTSTIADVAATRSELEKVKAEYTLHQGELRIAYAKYFEATGVYPQGALENPSLPANFPPDKDTIVKGALKNNYYVKELDARTNQANEQARGVLGGLLPTVDVVAETSQSTAWNKNTASTSGGNHFHNEHGNGSSVLAEVSIPIDIWGATQATVRQAKETAAQKKWEALQGRRSVVNRAVDAWEHFKTAEARVIQTKAQLDSAKIASESIREEYKAGIKSALDVIRVEQELISAQAGQIQSHFEHIAAAYRVLSEMGMLTSAHLGLPVKQFSLEESKKSVSFWGVSNDANWRKYAFDLPKAL